MPKWTSSAGFKVALIAFPIFIGALDLTVVSAVLPHVLIDLNIPFQTGMDDAAWIITGYLLAYSVSMTFMGRLSDIHGRRKVYLAALVMAWQPGGSLATLCPMYAANGFLVAFSLPAWRLRRRGMRMLQIHFFILMAWTLASCWRLQG